MPDTGASSEWATLVPAVQLKTEKPFGDSDVGIVVLMLSTGRRVSSSPHS